MLEFFLNLLLIEKGFKPNLPLGKKIILFEKVHFAK